jgi:hypothetical protein
MGIGPLDKLATKVQQLGIKGRGGGRSGGELEPSCMIKTPLFECTLECIMEHSGFYLTLPSNASADVYRNNKSLNYTTNFPKPIGLSEAWEVGLSEITYPYSWYNIKDKDCDFI